MRPRTSARQHSQQFRFAAHQQHPQILRQQVRRPFDTQFVTVDAQSFALGGKVIYQGGGSHSVITAFLGWV